MQALFAFLFPYFLLPFCLFTFFSCFSSLEAFTEAEMQQYRLLCKEAAQNESAYKKLRKNLLHRKIVEPFSKCNIEGYCLQIDREALLPQALYMQLAKWDTKLKGPKCKVSRTVTLSPLALRDAQIAIELEKEFGSLKHLRILQIGGGFGLLAAHLIDSKEVLSYTLVDVPECLMLQKKFLNSCGLSNITYLTPEACREFDAYDLVICAFPFTEWADDSLRETFLKKMTSCKRGYITCHKPWGPLNLQNTIEDHLLLTLAHAGHRVYCAPERGDLFPLHSVIRWGTQETNPPNTPLMIHPFREQLGNAVVTDGEGGRLGDKLLCYAHAKWLSHRYNLPLLVRPFPYFEGFALSKKYPILDSQWCYAHEMHPKNHREISQLLFMNSTLFVVDFFAETDFESHYFPHSGAYFYVGWRDRGFIRSLREDFAPQVSLEAPILDNSDVHLAVHLRLGGGFDNTAELITAPNCAVKVPQHSFYLEQIARVARIFPHQSIQVHLFTDDPNPEALAKMYQHELNNPQLHFTYRTAKNSHDLNVLDDFFAMSAYDCLIHPQSYFSTMAACLGDFAIRITPTHATWKTTHWSIDQVECSLDGTHPLFNKNNSSPD